jgi:predicted transcriptional regulator
MTEPTKKHKTFSITHYYRGIEIELICVTTSKKKFAELTNISLSSINKYASSYDLRYDICNENIDVVFAKAGMGGEVRYILNREDINPLDVVKKIINEHRKNYSTYRDFLEKTKKD